MPVKDSASAIICWNNKVLLFLRDDIPTIPYPNHWHLPGGGVEDNESSDECIKRELIEEVSHAPKGLKLLQKIRKPDGKYAYIYYSFVNDEEAKKFKIGKTEGQAVCFFTLKEMESLRLTPALRKNLKIYKTGLRKALKTKSFKRFLNNTK